MAGRFPNANASTQSGPASPGHRAVAALLATGCLSVLVLAAWLDPSTEGHGTHTQIGLQPCQWAVMLDAPCPTCGMTTAFAHAADANLATAALTQPLGALLALLTATVFWAATHVAVTGSRIWSACGVLFRPAVIWLLAALAVAAWAFKALTWNGVG